MLLGSALHIGGAERVIANLAKYLDRDCFDVTVCHLKEQGSIGAELKDLGYNVVGIPSVRKGWRRYFSFRMLAHVMKAHRIDLVHSHTTYALTDTSLCRLTRVSAVKLVHTFHFGNYPNYPRQYQMMEWFASRAADRLVAVGQEQLRAISKTYGLRADRLQPIVNGVEAVTPRPSELWGQRILDKDRVVVGTICTFIEQKGLPDLLRVARELAASDEKAVFVVVGDGPLRAPIERECAALGLTDRVLFAGWQTDAAAAMMPLFDIFFQPSLWEAMSMVVLEAMAAGKPVVVTDVGDNRHVVRDAETGFVVPARDVNAMAAALRRLVRSASLRRDFGHAGRRRYEALYTVQAMTKRYEDLYLQVLDGASALSTPPPVASAKN